MTDASALYLCNTLSFDSLFITMSISFFEPIWSISVGKPLRHRQAVTGTRVDVKQISIQEKKIYNRFDVIA